MKDILDRAGRALGSAETALDALGGINAAEIVLDRDRALRADPCALSAADTCDIAGFSGVSAFLLVVAADLYFGGLGNDLDQFLRAGLCAGAAACAVIASYDSDAVDDTDRVKFAGCYAVAKSDTTVRTLLASAKQLLGCLAGADIFILIKFGRVVGCARREASFLATAGPPTEHLVQGVSAPSAIACA